MWLTGGSHLFHTRADIVNYRYPVKIDRMLKDPENQDSRHKGDLMGNGSENNQ
jgi:hypothetical protein